MNQMSDFDYGKINAEVRALRAAEMRRLGLMFGAWLKRLVARRPVARTA